MNTYSHVTETMKQETVDLFEKSINKILPPKNNYDGRMVEDSFKMLYL